MAVDIGELRAFLTLKDQFSDPIDKASNKLSAFSAAVGVAGVAAGAIAGVTAAIIALGDHGSDVADVRGAFEDLTARAGETAETFLGEMRAGTMGLISDFELMKTGNKALGAGFLKTKEDAGTLAAGAKLLSDRMGVDTKDAFDSLMNAIATGKTTQLTQLGLFVDSKAAIQEYASETNQSVGAIDKSERASALAAATVAALKKELAASGEASLDFGERITAGKVQVQNFVDNLGEAIATSPVIQAGMVAMGKAIQDAFGGSSQESIKTITGYVNDFAIFLIDAGDVAVSVAQFIVRAFNGAKVIFNAVLELLFTGVEKVNRVLADLANKASDLPVVGDEFKTLATSFTGMADAANAVASGFKETKDKALDAAASAEAGFGKVHTVLGSVKAAMEAAKNETIATAEVVKTNVPAAMEEAAGRSDAANQKIKESFAQLNADIAELQVTGFDQRMVQLEAQRDAEIEGKRQIKEATAAELDAMVALVNEKYDLMKAKAIEDHDKSVYEAALQLQNDLTLATTTGLENRLAQIDISKEAELEKMLELAGGYNDIYTELAALVEAKYAQMTAAATISGEGIVAAANAAGFQTRAQLQETADQATKLYEEMLKSGQFSADALRDAFTAAEEAKKKAHGDRVKYQLTSEEALVQGTIQLFGVLGQKYKAVAIAGAIIATYQAIAKALASAPWPANLVLAAGAAAAGWANVSKIRSSESGFRFGATDTRFEDFGRGTQAVLHGRETVVTQKQGTTLAGMLVDAVDSAVGGAAAAAPNVNVNVQIGPREIREFMVDVERQGFTPGR